MCFAFSLCIIWGFKCFKPAIAGIQYLPELLRSITCSLKRSNLFHTFPLVYNWTRLAVFCFIIHSFYNLVGVTYKQRHYMSSYKKKRKEKKNNNNCCIPREHLFSVSVSHEISSLICGNVQKADGHQVCFIVILLLFLSFKIMWLDMSCTCPKSA